MVIAGDNLYLHLKLLLHQILRKWMFSQCQRCIPTSYSQSPNHLPSCSLPSSAGEDHEGCGEHSPSTTEDCAWTS